MTEVTTITNYHARDLLMLCEMPEDARREFDYVEEDDGYTYRFFQYRGEWYDSHEFMQSTNPALAYWHGIQVDTFFSATLIRFTDDYERVIVGRCYS